MSASALKAAFSNCSLATGNPDVHISLGCVERTGHAGPGAAVFGLPGVLHFCQVSGWFAVKLFLLDRFRSIHFFVLFILFCIFLRDPEIWRSACLRVWGRNCTKVVPFKTWREMFLQRPRVRFDGNDTLFQLQFYFVEMSEYLKDLFKELRQCCSTRKRSWSRDRS